MFTKNRLLLSALFTIFTILLSLHTATAATSDADPQACAVKAHINNCVNGIVTADGRLVSNCMSTEDVRKHRDQRVIESLVRDGICTAESVTYRKSGDCEIDSYDLVKLALKFGASAYEKIWDSLKDKGYSIVSSPGPDAIKFEVNGGYYYHNRIDQSIWGEATLYTDSGQTFTKKDDHRTVNLFSSEDPNPVPAMVSAVKDLPDCKDIKKYVESIRKLDSTGREPMTIASDAALASPAY